jgi:hypothetical protein
LYNLTSIKVSMPILKVGPVSNSEA